MFKLNRLLKKSWFELTFKTTLFGTLLVIAGPLFHAVYLSDLFATNYNLQKVCPLVLNQVSLNSLLTKSIVTVDQKYFWITLNKKSFG